MKAYRVVEVTIHAALTWALYGGESLLYALLPGKGLRYTLDRKSLGAGLALFTRKGNIYLCRESNTHCPVTMLTELHYQ
jgi:hypothetical protein